MTMRFSLPSPMRSRAARNRIRFDEETFMTTRLTMLVAFLVLALTLPAAARRPPRQGPMRAEMEARISTFLAVELARRLSLTETQSVKLAEALRAEREERAKAWQRVEAARESLEEALRTSPDNNEVLEKHLAAWASAEQSMATPGAFVARTRSFLSTQQQARLVVLMPDVREDARSVLREARRNAKREKSGVDD